MVSKRYANRQPKAGILMVSGKVIEALPNAYFRVMIDGKHPVVAHTAGRIRKGRIKIVIGDNVLMEMSVHDNTRGRIVHRDNANAPSYNTNTSSEGSTDSSAAGAKTGASSTTTTAGYVARKGQSQSQKKK